MLAYWQAQMAKQGIPRSAAAQAARADEAKELPERLVAEPIKAWRIWKITKADNVRFGVNEVREMSAAHDRGENPFAQLLLPSLSAVGQENQPWTQVMEATCLKTDHAYAQMRYSIGPVAPPHPAPNASCACGIWALNERADTERTVWEYAKQHTSLPGFAFGRVQLWGKIIRCERGYRAQYARPTEIIVCSTDERMAVDLARRYRCAARNEVPRTMLRIFAQERRKEKAKRELELKATSQMAQQLSNTYQQIYEEQLEWYKQQLSRPSAPSPPIKKRRGFFGNWGAT